MEQAVTKRQSSAVKTIASLLQREDTSARINELLGNRAPQFASSLISLVNSSKQLQECEPMSVLASGMIAATLDLPVNSNLGFAFLVPYKTKAQLQIGYKGFVQLAMRSGQYRALNVCMVYDGELESYDKLTGKLALKSITGGNVGKTIGCVAYMQLLNGYEHTEYWPIEKIQKHAETYSQAVRSKNQDSQWFTNPEAMAMKTVLKSMISHWGPMSIQMQNAVMADQGSFSTLDGEPEYIDNELTSESSGKRQAEAASTLKDKANKPEPTPEPPKTSATVPVAFMVTANEANAFLGEIKAPPRLFREWMIFLQVVKPTEDWLCEKAQSWWADAIADKDGTEERFSQWKAEQANIKV